MSNNFLEKYPLICLSAFKRIDNREYSIAPLSANNQVDLTKTEDILIKNAYIKG